MNEERQIEMTVIRHELLRLRANLRAHADKQGRLEREIELAQKAKRADRGAANDRPPVVTKHELDIQCLARESDSFTGTGLGSDRAEPLIALNQNAEQAGCEAGTAMGVSADHREH